MNIQLVIRAFVMFFLFCSQPVLGQENKNTFKTKGYILIASHEEIVFFPDSKATPKFCLSNLEKLVGIRVIGNSTYNYDIYRISKIAKPIIGKVTFVSYNGSNKTDYSFQLIPVQATLTHSPGLKGKESAFAFEKDGREYVYKYSDNFEYLLSEIVPIDTKMKLSFEKYKE